MKKLLFVSAILLATTTGAYAQKDSEGGAYEQGKSTVALGYGFGNVWKHLFKLSSFFSGGAYKVSSTGPFSLTYEYGVAEKISVGLAVSYSQVKGDYKDAVFLMTITQRN